MTRSTLLASHDARRPEQRARGQARLVTGSKQPNERLVLAESVREDLLGPAARYFAIVNADRGELGKVKMRVPHQIADTVGTGADVRDTVPCPIDSADLPGHTLLGAPMVLGNSLAPLLRLAATKILPEREVPMNEERLPIVRRQGDR